VAARPKKGLRVVAYIGNPQHLEGKFIDRLLDSRHDVAGVISAADKLPWKLRDSGIELVRLPGELKWKKATIRRKLKEDPEFRERFAGFLDKVRGLRPDIGVVFYGGGWIPPQLADLPKHGFLNFHPAPLPKLRGPYPATMMALEKRDHASGTVHRVADRFDQGDIVGRTGEVDISGLASPNVVYHLLEEAGTDTMMDALDRIYRGTARFEPQDASKATYCTRRALQEKSHIDWPTDEPAHISRKFDALLYTPDIFLKTTFHGRPLRVMRVERNRTHGRKRGEPGEIIAKEGGMPVIKTLKGAVTLDFDAPKLKKRMKVGERFT